MISNKHKFEVWYVHGGGKVEFVEREFSFAGEVSRTVARQMVQSEGYVIQKVRTRPARGAYISKKRPVVMYRLAHRNKAK